MKKMFTKIYTLHQNMTIQAKISFWFFVCSLLQKGIAFLTTPFYTRLLSSTDFGVVSIYNSWHDFIFIFATLNLSTSVYGVGLVHFEEDRDRYQSSILSLSILCSFLFSLLFLPMYGLLNDLIQLSDRIILFMCISFIFSPALTFWTIRQRFDYNYRKMIIITTINTLLVPAISITSVVLSNDKAEAKIISSIIVTCVISIFCIIDTFNKSKCIYNLKYWKFVIKYNLPLIPHFLSNIVLNQLDRIMINRYCGFSEAGIYSLANSCAQVALIINTAMSASYNPWILNKLKKKDSTNISRITNIILSMYFVVILIMILLSPEIIFIMATPEYYEAVYVIPPLACSMFFIFLYNIFSPIEQYSLKTKFIAIASTLAALLNIILNYIFIPLFGFQAAGYTTLVCYIIYALAHYIYMKNISISIMGEMIFDPKSILLLSIGIVALTFLAPTLYKFNVIRYILIVICLLLTIYHRNKIISVVYATLVNKGQ